MFEKIKKIHFVGIGGSGMCGIAEVLINSGYQVSGSDLSDSSTVRYLRSRGAAVNIGHREENIDDPHVVVISSAVGRDNCEVVKALSVGIPVIPRAEMLAELMRLKYSICVAGTHGKTTTTSMAGLILSQAGMDPTVVIGGRLKNLKSNVKLGKGEFLVAEADESDGSFLHYTPSIALVTNIDNDHLEYYGSIGNLRETFIEFINRVPFYGFSILCGDDDNIKKILRRLTRPFKTYGTGAGNDYIARDWVLCPEKSIYTAFAGDSELGRITIPSSGMHNVLNSLAACAMGIEMGMEFKTVSDALFQYQGVGRRLEKAGEAGGVVFYDDYAHHPTEIALSLGSLRQIYPERRLVVVFQPHRYSRTRDLYQYFPESLAAADIVFVTDIYSAGEMPVEGVTAEMITGSFRDVSRVRFVPRPELTGAVGESLRDGDVCLTLGAGDINTILPDLASGLVGG